MIEIRPLHKTDPVKAFRNFICELIDENTYLVVDKKPTMKEEREWFREKLKAIRNNQEIFLTAWDGKKYIGNCNAIRGRWKEADNVCIDMAILKEYRGRGLGERLLRETIRLTKRKFKPRNIYLTVAARNKPAYRLYQKVGFREIARFPKWRKQDGRYIDKLFMILKN